MSTVGMGMRMPNERPFGLCNVGGESSLEWRKSLLGKGSLGGGLFSLNVERDWSAPCLISRVPTGTNAL